MLHEGALVLVGGGGSLKKIVRYGVHPPHAPHYRKPWHISIGITHRQKQPSGGALQRRCPLEISQKQQENTYARASLLIKRLWHRCPPVNSVKSPRAPFYSTPVLSGSCFYTKAKSSLIFSLISSMRNCKTKLWKKMKIRAERKGKWMQATFRRLFLRNILFLLLFKS